MAAASRAGYGSRLRILQCAVLVARSGEGDSASRARSAGPVAARRQTEVPISRRIWHLAQGTTNLAVAAAAPGRPGPLRTNIDAATPPDDGRPSPRGRQSAVQIVTASGAEEGSDPGAPRASVPLHGCIPLSASADPPSARRKPLLLVHSPAWNPFPSPHARVVWRHAVERLAIGLAVVRAEGRDSARLALQPGDGLAGGLSTESLESW